ncbi:MAG TPA: benzoate/H(+) symporter BenE family transporter [Thermomicrobiales bacterium]|nr:benzoate/H(+) symporter BenE family transporter [Thermomicrobiales bacterium]
MLKPIGFDAALPGAGRRSWFADVNGANVAAGMTAGLFYAFGAIPVHLDAMASLGLSSRAAVSWFFVTFMTSALGSLVLTLRYRMPLPIGWSIPALVFLVGAGNRYSHAEMAGACLIAGAMIIAMGLLGVTERLLRWLPLPIIMGMFAGNVIGIASGAFKQLESQPLVVGAAIAGYVAARAGRRNWCPPMAGAFVAGLLVAAITRQVQPDAFTWSAPVADPIRPQFDPVGVVALAVPLVVIGLGMGGVQGLGLLAGEGYRPPVRILTVWMGVTTLVNAGFGGHVATIQNNGVAVLGGLEAGPRDQRYVGSVIASVLAFFLALCAATAGSLLAIFPAGFVPALAGLALLSVLMDALRKATQTTLQTGAFFALAIAASRVTLLGVGAAFWALIGGLAVSFCLERPALRQAWQGA